MRIPRLRPSLDLFLRWRRRHEASVKTAAKSRKVATRAALAEAAEISAEPRWSTVRSGSPVGHRHLLGLHRRGQFWPGHYGRRLRHACDACCRDVHIRAEFEGRRPGRQQAVVFRWSGDAVVLLPRSAGHIQQCPGRRGAVHEAFQGDRKLRRDLHGHPAFAGSCLASERRRAQGAFPLQRNPRDSVRCDSPGRVVELARGGISVRYRAADAVRHLDERQDRGWRSPQRALGPRRGQMRRERAPLGGGRPTALGQPRG
mmetsp:Transcript_97368/g.275241  ORF Transcript_97368/g.275241 Transcript_97368/m.275241 type:complete len:258 (+) Transcript_97368:154-927(+)